MVTVLCKRNQWELRQFFIRVLSRDNIREFKKKKNRTVTETGASLKKGLMGRTLAVCVHYNSQYISLRSSVKQQREMTKFCIVWRT